MTLLLLYPGSPHPSFQPQDHKLSDGNTAPCWNPAGEVERSLPCGIHNPTPQQITTWLHGGCSPFQPTLVSHLHPNHLPQTRNSITCMAARSLLRILRKSSSRHTGDSGKLSAMDKAGEGRRKAGRKYTWRQQAVRTCRPLYPCPISTLFFPADLVFRGKP